MEEITLEKVTKQAEELGKSLKENEILVNYFTVIKSLSGETRDELLEKDFFNKLFNGNDN
ncbi:MAG: hypothetical protein ACJAW3_001330 [Lentimonas sp.]|jgi:hypothetical protein